MNIVQRGELLRKIITQARTQNYPYDKRAPKKVDWHAYDVAQANEIADVIDIIRVSVDVAAYRKADRIKRSRRGRGQPPVPAEDVVKVLLMQTYLGVSNRVAEGLTRLLWTNLGLGKPFSYKTIERGYDRRAVDALMDEVLALTNAPVEDLEKVFGIDGSGTPTRKRQNYAEAREEQRKNARKDASASDAFPKARHDFVYSVFVVGARFKLISAWRNTSRHDIGELAFFDPLMRETKTLHPRMEMIVGDGSYAGRPQVNLVRELGAVARFLPRRNATLKRLGSDGWIEMLLPLTRDPQNWLFEYYQREASENVNSVIKSQNPQPLRKRLIPRKSTEDKLRGLCYNLRRLCYLYYLAGLTVNPAILAKCG